jgi:hypothetical protein
MPSSNLSWQVGAAALLLVLCGLWLLFQSLVLRIILAASLGISVLGILALSGILTSNGENPPRELHQDTQVLALFILVLAIFFALFAGDLVGNVVVVWVAVMILFVIFLAMVGVCISGRPLGLLIDSRNRVSLSTFQTILWTVVILSAFFTVAAILLQAGKGTSAFDIALDQQLWALMGISVTTLAGTPLIRDVKSQRKVRTSILRDYALRHPAKVLAKALEMGKVSWDRDETDVEVPGVVFQALLDKEEILREVLAMFMDGPLCKDPDPKTVTFLDIFRGDELVDCRRVDLGKVQMFFFTVMGALVYMVVLANWIATLNTGAATIEFPALSAGFIAILGISHAGFLGNTAAPKTPGAGSSS